MAVSWPRLHDALVRLGSGIAATAVAAIAVVVLGLIGQASTHPTPTGPVAVAVAPDPQVIADSVIARHLEAQR